MNKPPSSTKTPRLLPPVVRVIGLVVLGAVAGVLIGYTASGAGYGYRERWDLAEMTAPQGTTGLLMYLDLYDDCDVLGLCARTKDRVYKKPIMISGCSKDKRDKYIRDDSFRGEANCVELGPGWRSIGAYTVSDYASPCRKRWPEFSFLANAPRRVVSCVSFDVRQNHWFQRGAFALDDEGQIWSWWYQGDYFDVGNRLLFSTVVGGIVGSIVVLVFRTIWVRRKTMFGDASTTNRGLGFEAAQSWFWIVWVLANVAGWACVWAGAGSWFWGDETIYWAAVSAGAPPLVGTAQWFVLRKRVRRSGWWVLAHVVGWAAGWTVVFALAMAWLDETVGMLIGGAVGGVLAGTAQRFILRQRVRGAGWWVLTHAVSFAVGWAVWGVLDVYLVNFTDLGYVESHTLAGACAEGVYAVITGTVLVLLLRRSMPSPVTPRPPLDGEKGQ